MPLLGIPATGKEVAVAAVVGVKIEEERHVQLLISGLGKKDRQLFVACHAIGGASIAIIAIVVIGLLRCFSLS